MAAWVEGTSSSKEKKRGHSLARGGKARQANNCLDRRNNRHVRREEEDLNLTKKRVGMNHG